MTEIGRDFLKHRDYRKKATDGIVHETDRFDELARDTAHQMEWDAPLGAEQYGAIAQALRDTWNEAIEAAAFEVCDGDERDDIRNLKTEKT